MDELTKFVDNEEKPESAIKTFTSRIRYALMLGLKEKEIFFFGLLQLLVIMVGYVFWLQVLNWIPQEAYYYSVENCGFRPRPFRTQGTYSKYNSIDDKIDDLHYYTSFIKFGFGRATYDVSQEIRNNHISIDEGKKLIKKYDGEFPNIYFKEIMDYLNIKPNFFHKLCDKFRSPHLWKKVKGKYYLRHTVNEDGTDD